MYKKLAIQDRRRVVLNSMTPRPENISLKISYLSTQLKVSARTIYSDIAMLKKRGELL